MGERRPCTAEVAGSTPVSSTPVFRSIPAVCAYPCPGPPSRLGPFVCPGPRCAAPWAAPGCPGCPPPWLCCCPGEPGRASACPCCCPPCPGRCPLGAGLCPGEPGRELAGPACPGGPVWGRELGGGATRLPFKCPTWASNPVCSC